MKVLIVYAHPSQQSFTYQVKQSFIQGLKDAGQEIIENDLYHNHFQSEMSEQEYLREAFYRDDLDIPQDIKNQQQMIQQSDAIVFIYPVFWSEAPSILVGWFQRVWTYGFRYGKTEMKMMDKVLCLVTMGGDCQEALRQRQIEAMKEVMINDRLAPICKESEFIVFDRMSRDYPDRDLKMQAYLDIAYQKGKDFLSKNK